MFTLFRKRNILAGKNLEYPEAIVALAWVPQDILAEICWNLGPQELYSLSRTCKSLRVFLTSRSNAGPIWHHAIQKAVADGSLPPPSPYVECELRWAHLIFGNFCSICFIDFEDPVPGVGVLWQFNARYCSSCLPSQVQTRLPRELERCIPRHEWWGLFPHISQPRIHAPLYSSKQLSTFTKHYSSLRTSKDREAYMSWQRAQTLAISAHAVACYNWEKTIPQVKSTAAALTRSGRRQDPRDHVAA
ncbi:F-box domain-containing protein [Mycena venus]|uniref:F-box domain-containing protein n=1 Tax=Mycena venus TaxID=2733690 RepID=A0A8H6YD94_9AGAR|nr:F-box domain-containing protein [Mycena venus]